MTVQAQTDMDRLIALLEFDAILLLIVVGFNVFSTLGMLVLILYLFRRRATLTDEQREDVGNVVARTMAGNMNPVLDRLETTMAISQVARATSEQARNLALVDEQRHALLEDRVAVLELEREHEAGRDRQ